MRRWRPPRPASLSGWIMLLSVAVMVLLSAAGLTESVAAVLGLVPSLFLWREMCGYLTEERRARS